MEIDKCSLLRNVFKPQETWGSCNEQSSGNTNTGEGVKGKKAKTTSHDAGGKSVSEKSKSTGGKCVSENSTGGKPGATRTSNNPFEASRSEKPLYFVDVVKDKRTKNNNLEILSLHESATGVQRHRPSDVVEAAPARVA